MNEYLKAALEIGIENEGVERLLKIIADLLAGRARNIRNIDVQKKYQAAITAIDNARLEIDI